MKNVRFADLCLTANLEFMFYFTFVAEYNFHRKDVVQGIESKHMELAPRQLVGLGSRTGVEFT